MRTFSTFCLLPLLALAACHADVNLDDANSNSGDEKVHVAMNGTDNKISVNVPGFNANVTMPNLDLGNHMDLDGIKMAPDSKVTTFDVEGHDKGGNKDEGNVRIAFTNPAAPAALLDHYARSAADAGYGAITRTANSLTARKDDKSFALNLAPQGTGSQGTIVVSGKD